MQSDPHKDIFTIGIGGAAGDGVREAGQSLCVMLCDLGYEVYLSFSYPSLIRGGHNFSRITFSKEKVWSDHEKLDVLIALNEETIQIHKNELHDGAVVLADAFELDDLERLGKNAVVVPMSTSAKELEAPAITRNSVALGATCYLLELNYSKMQNVLADVFKNKRPELNIKLADIGYEHLKSIGFRHAKKIEPRKHTKEVMDGNTAFGKGLESAGLDFYVSYPMTPATGILHYLAGQRNSISDGKIDGGMANHSVKTIQPESELSVINMALGIAYAGKRVAVGSATGGFALMEEALSFAGIAELPLVIAVSQRQAPATGVPTYSSQSDLLMAIHSGHGEFPKIVIAPGDTEESFLAGVTALNLAWKYQLPVIVLLDKILSEHSMTTSIPKEVMIERGRIADKTDGSYGRYEISADGISPMVFSGTPETIVKVTSYEHDQFGITAEDAGPVKTMIDKRFAKTETLNKELFRQETVKVYGDKDSKKVIVFWGSTKGPVLEAAKYLETSVKLLQIVWMEPFDVERVAKELKGAEKIINIECNHNAQMAGLIRQKTGIEVTDNILRYDSRPFDPVELAGQINTLLK
jgi:2-oxoglutarate ferredoxin oxidoreductase subunit alpha